MTQTTTITTREEAKAFWAAYEATKSRLHVSDLECEAAGFPNPRREDVFDRDFWTNIYTPEVHAALKAFGQEYYD
jgi:hypothetical protein